MEFFGVVQLAALVITALITAAGTIFGGKYKAIKSLVRMMGEAIEDDKITKEELQEIYKQAKKLF